MEKSSVTAGRLFALPQQLLSSINNAAVQPLPSHTHTHTHTIQMNTHPISPLVCIPCCMTSPHRGQNPTSRLAGHCRIADQVQRSQSCAKRWHQRVGLSQWPRDAWMALKQHPIYTHRRHTLTQSKAAFSKCNVQNAALYSVQMIRWRGCEAAECKLCRK